MVRWPLQAKDFCLLFGTLGPLSFLLKGNRELFNEEWSGRHVRLTAHCHMVPRKAENAGRCTVRPHLVSSGLSASLTSEGQVQSQASEREIYVRQSRTEANSSTSASVLPRQRHSVNASYRYAFICQRRYIILAMGNILCLPAWCGYRLITHRNNFALALYLDAVTSRVTVDETTWDQNSYVMIAWCRAVVFMLDFRPCRRMRSALFWNVTWRLLAVNGHFWITCRSHFQGSSSCLTLEDETDRSSQNIVNYFKWI